MCLDGGVNQQLPIDLPYVERELANVKARLERIEVFLSSFSDATIVVTDPLELDEMFDQAVRIIQHYDRASASMLQRHLGIGYARSARILEQLADKQLISSPNGTSKPRQVYKDKIQAYLKENP